MGAAANRSRLWKVGSFWNCDSDNRHTKQNTGRKIYKNSLGDYLPILRMGGETKTWHRARENSEKTIHMVGMGKGSANYTRTVPRDCGFAEGNGRTW